MKVFVEYKPSTNIVTGIFESLRDVVKAHAKDCYVYAPVANAASNGSTYKGLRYASVDTAKPIDEYDDVLKPIYKKLVDALDKIKIYRG